MSENRSFPRLPCRSVRRGRLFDIEAVEHRGARYRSPATCPPRPWSAAPAWSGSGRHGGRRAHGQVPRRRNRQGDPAHQRAGGDPGRLHHLAGLSRLQRRLAARARRRGRRGGDRQCPGQHQPGRGGGGSDNRAGPLPPGVRARGRTRVAQRCDQRSRGDHGGAGHRGPFLGDRHRRDRGCRLHARHEAPASAQDR